MSIVLSERQRPRALQLMKATYASHTHDPACGLGEQCPQMMSLKLRIEELEREEKAHAAGLSRSLQLE
jgi:hypothetical protein